MKFRLRTALPINLEEKDPLQTIYKLSKVKNTFVTQASENVACCFLLFEVNI